MSARILVVDDILTNVKLLEAKLTAEYFEVLTAQDGLTALEMAANEAPDLVLLDVMMPRKSGVHVYTHMKGKPELANIPIIIVTGASAATGVDVHTGEAQPKETYGDDLARGLGTVLHDALKGVTPDALIEKPIEPQSLIDKVNELLR